MALTKIQTGGVTDAAVTEPKLAISGTGSTSNFLRGDMSWTTVPPTGGLDMEANTVKVRDANSTGSPSNKTVADTQLLIGDGTGFTAAALSGDVTMANTGAVAIASGVVVDADVNASAAIAQSKLATLVITDSNVADNALSGNKIDGGTISSFTSTGIDDNAASTALTLDGSQNVLVTQKVFVGGATASVPVSNGQQNWVQQHEASNRGGTTWFSTHASAGGAESAFAKGRSGTLGNFTIVQDDDVLGTVTWCADDGVDMNSVAAQLRVAIDGTPGANDTPGRMMFLTTPDGSASPTERLRIGSAGQFGIAGENYGTSGQVFSSGGAGAAASWQDAGGSAAAGCAFRVAKSSTQSCSQNADTEISWQTSVFDVGSDFDLANNRFDCPAAGTYWFHFQVSTSFTFQNIEELCYIKHTNSAGGSVTTMTYRSDEPINDSNARGRAQGIYMEVSGTVVCASGDRLTCRFRSEGDTKTINSAAQQTFFEGYQLI